MPMFGVVEEEKKTCPKCGGVVEVVSDHSGNTLMHVRTTWDHRRETSVECFTDPESVAPMSDREQDDRIKDLEARVESMEQAWRSKFSEGV